MYNYHNKKKFIYSIFLLLLLVIGIGYAYLTSNLSIAGNTQVTTNTWNIHFENLNVSTGSVSTSTPAEINASGDAITYTINLNRPKEYYEFTVDVKNDGTLPGKISVSTLSGLDTTSSKIIDYSIKYTNGNPVNVGDILNGGATKNIKVRVFYKDDIDPDDFPNNDLNLILTYTLQYVQSEEDEDEFDTSDLIKQLKTENSSCMYQHTGSITDEVGNTENITSETSKVYFNRCEDKRSIIFGGFCWQMIRTTQTGGIKMIYNGEPDQNGECGSSRETHKGIVQTNYGRQNIGSSYLYGSSFTYNTTTSEFTLIDTETATWSDSTYQNLIGKFTCKSQNNTCTTLYQINSYYSNTNAYVSYYTIADTNYAQIGTSSFNANQYSLAMVGYMFNNVYNYKTKSISGTNRFGSTFTYENGTYTISGETQDLTTLNDANIANTHYTCWNDFGTCTSISYVYYKYTYKGYYIEISDGKSITDAINEMLYNNDVNRYNSSVKGIIDNWYTQNLSTKTNMLEDTVYCNARNLINRSTSGWNPDGGSTSTYLYFKNNNLNINLSCTKETDQFAVGNNKAKLTYPVALATQEELYTLTNNNDSTYFNTLTNTGSWWWVLSPLGNYLTNNEIGVVVSDVTTTGNVNGGNNVYGIGGVRPVISLASGTVISEGDGSETSPWVIQE